MKWNSYTKRMLSQSTVGLLALGLFACSKSKDSSDTDGVSGEETAELPMTTASLSLAEASTGLRLAGEDFTGQIVGCKSGWANSSITEADTTLSIPETDINCVFELLTATINSETYDFSAVSNWSEGSSFVAAGSGGSTLTFVISSTLPDADGSSRIGTSESIAIEYGTFTQGTAANIDGATSAGVTLSGSEAIALEIDNIGVLVDETDGHGIFTVAMLCGSAVAGGKCDGIPLADIKVFLGVRGTAPADLAECMNAGATGASAHDAYASGNGGLITQSNPLDGPATLYGAGNDELILIVSHESGSKQSCKYFELDVVKP